MNAANSQKPFFRTAIQIIAVLVAIPQVVRAGEPADLSRFNVQSCVSNEVREATAQKYLKSINVPQYPRQFLSNLKYALEHDWLLQEDFYTVNNIQHLLGVSEVYVSCLEHKHFLPGFSAYGTLYRLRTDEKPPVPLPDPNSIKGFYNQSGNLSTGSLKRSEGGRLEGGMSIGFMNYLALDFIEMTFGLPMLRHEFLRSLLAKEFADLSPPRPGDKYFDLSDENT